MDKRKESQSDMAYFFFNMKIIYKVSYCYVLEIVEVRKICIQ